MSQELLQAIEGNKTHRPCPIAAYIIVGKKNIKQNHN